jgi:hypothetical protein
MKLKDVGALALALKRRLFGSETVTDVVSLSWIGRGWRGDQSMISSGGSLLALTYVLAVFAATNSLPNPIEGCCAINMPIAVLNVLGSLFGGSWCAITLWRCDNKLLAAVVAVVFANSIYVLAFGISSALR